MNNKYNSDEFKEALVDIGLAKDDNVFIHTSLKTIGKYEVHAKNPPLWSRTNLKENLTPHQNIEQFDDSHVDRVK